MKNATPCQHLVSLPPAMAREFHAVTGLPAPEWLAAHDPPGGKLGSGGGIAHLLDEARRQTLPGQSMSDWLAASPKLLLMAGGQSRRLPAYAAEGKLLLPMPVLRWAVGQHLEQTLLDLQVPAYRSVLEAGAPHYRALVTSGDVLLRFPTPPSPLPEVDVLGFGMWVRPETAHHFGVFFSPRTDPRAWSFFRQKPSAAEIRELATEYFYLVDTGMWLLSERAVRVLLGKCGWQESTDSFAGGQAGAFELYAGFGLSLGTQPTVFDPEISALTCAVVPLPEAEFYHLGTSRQLIESVSALQNLQLDQTKLGGLASRPHPDQYILNSEFSYPRRLEQNHTLWIENSCVPASWTLQHDHVLTGVPPNDWSLSLPAGVCLDFVPIGETAFCFRPYGIDDAFRGALGAETTPWLGHSVSEWFAGRGLSLAEAGLLPETDLQEAALFPVLEPSAIDQGFLTWMVAREPGDHPQWRRLWLESRRFSAATLCEEFSPSRLRRQRETYLLSVLPEMAAKHRHNPFYRLDLAATAGLFAKGEFPLPDPVEETLPLTALHNRMFRATVLRMREAKLPGSTAGDAAAADEEAAAFVLLREALLSGNRLPPVEPRRHLLDDQILWGRSPVRLDLAGGWTDTPPYCLEHGGKVVNCAVTLNGQPPIQVFARAVDEPRLVVRSIDLGVESRITTYEELADFARPESEFALAKAALALCGFLPQFHAGGGAPDLRRHLEAFGGGVEISLLAAVPKGSGLGTSSILSATLLGVLSELCGLGWDQATLYSRTLALEQLLTTGGGWQDQIGGITRGVKLVETDPGLSQQARLRWAPEHLLTDPAHAKCALLYYTGLTRMAKSILREIVRGMFLNQRRHLDLLQQIGDHALGAYQVLQSGSWTELGGVIETTWQLKQALDAGTNPPAVQAILHQVAPWTLAATLLGAGGGGYVLFLAHDEEAAGRIRQELTDRPPNARARFVEWAVSHEGLQITRS